MIIHAYGIVLLSFLLPCVRAFIPGIYPGGRYSHAPQMPENQAGKRDVVMSFKNPASSLTDALRDKGVSVSAEGEGGGFLSNLFGGGEPKQDLQKVIDSEDVVFFDLAT